MHVLHAIQDGSINNLNFSCGKQLWQKFRTLNGSIICIWMGQFLNIYRLEHSNWWQYVTQCFTFLLKLNSESKIKYPQIIQSWSWPYILIPAGTWKMNSLTKGCRAYKWEPIVANKFITRKYEQHAFECWLI